MGDQNTVTPKPDFRQASKATVLSIKKETFVCLFQYYFLLSD